MAGGVIHDQSGLGAHLSHVVRAPDKAFQPTLQMSLGPQQGQLAAIACRVGQHEVVRQIARILRERNEVVNVRHCEAEPAVETLCPVNAPQPLGQLEQRLPGCLEQKALEIVDVAQDGVVAAVALEVTDPVGTRE